MFLYIVYSLITKLLPPFVNMQLLVSSVIPYSEFLHPCFMDRKLFRLPTTIQATIA
jgi:hypothetical protein